MKLLFLDIDGVLNDPFWNLNHPSNNADDYIDPVRVAILNRILQETGAKVVITSTWRCTFTPERLQKHLETFGFIGEIIGATEDDDFGRMMQIFAWLSDAKFPYRFVVLDDEEVFGSLHPEMQKRNQYLTDPKMGLTEEDGEKIIAMLK